jgi:hypothetical protein
MVALILMRERGDAYREYMRKYMLDPATKSFTIGSRLAGCREDVLLAELEKCVLRCNPCHTARTVSQQAVEHGAGRSGKRNCKCAKCKARKAEYMRSWVRKSGTS